ncbi:AAEL015342-PA [Aedes aegypti]|uniref:AAEL015342-PA n=1 Tax=Aedes aegypti TaxID=7159 RepID=Q16E80_AEDAE|nr:AAEL015342-PA [Aedes aegypti]
MLYSFRRNLLIQVPHIHNLHLRTTDKITNPELTRLLTPCSFPTFQSHIADCGQVLSKCPNGCGVYVALKDMDRHLNRCPAGFGEAPHQDGDRIRELELEIVGLRSTLNEEIRQRLALITDIGQLKKRTQLGDEWTAKVGDVLNALKKCINEETDSRCVDVERCKLDINRLMREYERIEAWRLELTTRINRVGELAGRDEVDKPKDAKLVMIESRLNYLQTEVETLREEQKDRKGDEKAQEGNELVKGKIGVGDEQLDKQAKLDYELKGVLNTVNETEDKSLEKYRRETYYTKQSLDDLQVHLQHQEKLVVIQNTEGHLIWRIDQFEKRFEESQQSEFMLKSPLFSNRPFGYTLRMEASLNGIGTWRGRNMIVGLVVVNGFYDNLLEWPCVLSGTITLRDQPQDRAKPRVDYRRSIVARRKHQSNDKNQNIHIPHQVLRSEHYIRDDAIFLEVRIDQ